MTIPVHPAQALQTQSCSFPNVRRNRDDHIPLLQSLGDSDQLPGSLKGFLWCDHDLSMEIQFFRRGSRRDGMKTRPATKPPIWAQKAMPPTFLGVRLAENNWTRSQ